MKDLGPIPPYFSAIDGELTISGRKASALVEEAGDTPLFVYSAEIIKLKIAALRKVFPSRIALHYAVKANPYKPILELMRSIVDGFDIASMGEFAEVAAASIDPQQISFAGPGKRDSELETAIAAGITLNLESENEARRALAIADRRGIRPRLAIRVNPSFEIRGSGMKMGGGAKPFGVDAERVPALAKEIIGAGAEWRGLHIFAGSQSLDAAALIEAQGLTLDLAAQLAEEIGRPLPALNLGGGFGIPYFPADRPLDIAPIGVALAERMQVLKPPLQDTEFAMELGRYLVGEAGVYLTRIVDRKQSHGRTFLVTDGGLHHQLAASGNFGTVVRRNYPVAIASHFDAEPEEEADVVGCLCTPLDRLADQAFLPRANTGDLVVVFCAGAYGLTASPERFLGHPPAREMLV